MEEVHRWLLLFAPLGVVLAVCVPLNWALEMLTLLSLSVLTLCGGRLLQQHWQTVDAGEYRTLSAGDRRCWQLCYYSAALLLLLTLLDVLDDDGSYGTLMLILTNWPLVPMVIVMAGEYRTAMELATPMRHASEISFTEDDFKEFARCFQHVLEQILKDRTSLKNQLTLVPISDSTKLAEQVMEKLQFSPPSPSPQ